MGGAGAAPCGRKRCAYYSLASVCAGRENLDSTARLDRLQRLPFPGAKNSRPDPAGPERLSTRPLCDSRTCRPSVTERVYILPPGRKIGPLTAAQRAALIARSLVAGVDEKRIHRESACEKLTGRAANATAWRRLRRSPLRALLARLSDARSFAACWDRCWRDRANGNGPVRVVGRQPIPHSGARGTCVVTTSSMRWRPRPASTERTTAVLRP